MRLSELAPGSLIMCLLPRVADLRNRNIQYTHKRKGYSQGKMADFVKLIKEWLNLLSWLQNGWFLLKWLQNGWFCWGDYKMVDFVEVTTKWLILLKWLKNGLFYWTDCKLHDRDELFDISPSIQLRPQPKWDLYLLFYCVLYLYLLFSCVSARRRGKCLWQTTLQVSIVRQQT